MTDTQPANQPASTINSIQTIHAPETLTSNRDTQPASPPGFCQPPPGTVSTNPDDPANLWGTPFSVLPPDYPTQQGPFDIQFDFNDGARLLLPPGDWHAEIIDEDADNVLFACDSQGGWIVSVKKYFVRFRFVVWKKGEENPCFDHILDLKDKEVLVSFPVATLGDLIGWFPYAERFRQKHGCKLTCSMGPLIIDLFKDQYPDITFTTPKFAKEIKPYATYRIGLFFKGDTNYQPIDFRKVGLHRTSGYILGVDPEEIVPKFKLGSKRKIKEPYVCIATQATTQCKYWNNGAGWVSVVEYLKKAGYRVLCIDQKPLHGQIFTWNHIPYGSENFTGDHPLQERIALLEHADFFVGLSSGLAWLAWGCKIPVVLISGFTLPTCEFKTPYRVYNSHGCMGCWDDVNENFDHQDFFWCPKHKGTERQFECTRLITGKQVIGHIQQVMRDIGKTPPEMDKPLPRKPVLPAPAPQQQNISPRN